MVHPLGNGKCFIQSQYVAKLTLIQGPAHSTDHAGRLTNENPEEGGNTLLNHLKSVLWSD